MHDDSYVIGALAFAALGGVCFTGARGTSAPIGIFFIPAAIFWLMLAALLGYSAWRVVVRKTDKP